MGYGDVQMIDANGIRNDGRKAGDVRPISIELGVVPVADGSCRMRWGTNEVIAAIYGPMEAHPRKIQRQDRAVLDVRYNMAPFSTSDRIRPGFNRRSREISKVTAEALESVVLTLDAEATGDDAGIYSGKHFTLNRRSTDGVVYELAPGTGTDIVWNFYAGEHDGTTRNVVQESTTELVNGELYTLDLAATEVITKNETENENGDIETTYSSSIDYEVNVNAVSTDVISLTDGLSFGSIDLKWQKWNQLVIFWTT